MKTISFYTEKGGTGKSTFTMLFASWLSYVKGLKVGVVDLDCPAYHLFNTRKREERLLGINEREDPDYQRAAYLRRHTPSAVYDVVKVDGTSTSEVIKVLNFLENARRSDAYDVILFDFPGSFRAGDAALTMIQEQCLDNIFCPMRMDEKEISSINRFVRTVKGIDPLVRIRLFWNFTGRTESKLKYTQLREVFASLGFDMSPTAIPYLIGMRKESEEGAFCSTMYFPEALLSRKMPELTILFDEFLEFINKY